MVMRFLLLLQVLLLALPAHAARLVLAVEQSEVFVGGRVRATVTVINGEVSGVPSLTVPEGLLAGFSHQAAGFSMTGFQQTSSVRYTYNVVGLEQGNYTLGPVTVEVGGQRLTTNSVDFKVVERPADAEAQLWVTTDFLPDSVWEGQVVLYRAQLHAHRQVLRSEWNLPKFTGLIPPRDGDALRRQFEVEGDDGEVTRVDEHLLPRVVASTGTLDQRAAVVVAHVVGSKPRRRNALDPFGRMTSTKQITLVGQEAPLKAKPLPPAPADFSGLVGEFSFDQLLGSTEAKVGDSVPWTLRVEGNGTLEGFSLPSLGDVDGARIYDEAPSVGARTTPDGYLAGGTMPRVVVPTKEGTLTLPDVSIVTFSVREGRYVTHKLAGPTLTVKPGAAGALQVDSYESLDTDAPPPEVEAIDDGPRAAWRGISAGGWASGTWLSTLLMITLLPGFMMWFLVGWLAAVDRYGVVREAAVVLPSQRLNELPDDLHERLAALEGALRESVRRASEVPAALAGELAEVTQELQRARYADGGISTDLSDRVRSLVQKLEVV